MDGFILEESEKECVKLNILNCLKIRKETRECLKCNSDLIPYKSECIIGDIQYCLEYDMSNNKVLTCT